MNVELLTEFFMAGLRLSVPLLFAAYGGILSERSGVANIALEAYLLFSAFLAATVASLTGSLVLAVGAGLLGSVLVSALLAWLCVQGKAEQIVTGTGINLLFAGLIPILTRSLFGAAGATPGLPIELRFSRWEFFFVAAVVVIFVIDWIFRRSSLGLRITFAGEKPQALLAQGVSVNKVRWAAITLGGLAAGLGGVYISLVQASGYTRNMSAGRGYLALAAVIFGGWKPWPAFFACLFFGFADSAQMLLQGTEIGGHPVPHQFIQILPYVVTLLLLAGSSRKVLAPTAINSN